MRSDFAVPDLVAIEVDPALGDAEPDEEIHDLVGASGGTNLGMDFLPGALAFNPAVRDAGAVIDPDFAADVVWLDSLVTNPDRTVAKPEPPRVARPAVAHRPRRRAVHPSHLARSGRARPTTVRVGPRSMSCSPTPDRSPRPMRETPRRSTTRSCAISSGRSPTSGCRRIPSSATPKRSATRTSGTFAKGSHRRGRSSRRPNVPAPRDPFQYAIVRVLPRVERGECFNAGIVLLCRPRRFLGCPHRARRAPPRRAGAGARSRDGPAASRRHPADRRRRRVGRPIARLGQAERFHWLVSPSSTMIQPGEVHSGLCDDPAAELDHLVATLVRQALQRPRG